MLGLEGSLDEWEVFLDNRNIEYLERFNRSNGTVTIEYRNAAEESDIGFEFPPRNGEYNQVFKDVRYNESDCGRTSCFRLGYYDDDSDDIYARLGGAFYGPESQEFGGFFSKIEITGTRRLIGTYGATRQ